MFSKGLFVFGLLAIFGCQVSNANITDLVNQVKEVQKSLVELVNGVIADALSTLGNIASTIQSIREKFLQDGNELVASIVGEVPDYINNITSQAAELGIDVTVCVNGTAEQLEILKDEIIKNLTACGTETTDSVMNTVNHEIIVINQIVREIINIPVNLSKCLISLRPISCVTKLLSTATTMLTSLPGQIQQIVSNTVDLVPALQINLRACLDNIGASATIQTQNIIQKIEDCAEQIFSNGNATTTAVPA